MACAVCRRKMPRAGGWVELGVRKWPGGDHVQFRQTLYDNGADRRPIEAAEVACGWDCWQHWLQRIVEKYQVPRSDHENNALEAASDAAGAYLEQVKKWDLSTLSPQEWRELLFKAITAYEYRMQIITDDDVPF